MRFALVVAALLAATLPAAPALAQDAAGDKVNLLVTYGDDACPVPTGDEILVCVKKAESERYRIPEMFRGSESPQNEAWTERVQSFEMVSRTGTLSCTPVGPGGSTGCLSKMINTAYAEKGLAPDVRFADLIAAERDKRLSTIDQRSAEEQARVEQLEKEYEAKRKAEEAATSAAGSDAEPPAIPPRK